jgi:archaellum biogenesis ATPase FlaH
MQLNKKIFVISGPYGSGKSEFCLNFAYYLKAQTNNKIYIADYDVINPYFRSRELASTLIKDDIHVLGNNHQNEIGQDMPAIAGNISQAIFEDAYLIIDLAGDINGIKPLSLIYQNFKDNYEMLVVINVMREITNDERRIVDFINQLQSQCQLKISGLINNANLISESDLDMTLRGEQILEKVSSQLNLNVFCSITNKNIEGTEKLKYPHFTFDQLYLRKTWM